MSKIYFDNAATTMLRKEVFDEMVPFLIENYGNPSSIYSLARTSKKAVDSSREKISNLIKCSPNEIYFTSGGTEADNWAIKSFAYANRQKGNHIITSAIEHHAVLHICEYLEKNGFEVTYLPVDEYGLINIDNLVAAIKPSTILISIMMANNEIGTIQPVSEIGAIAREKGIIFHTDAVQAVGHIDIDVKEQNIDMLSMSAHKVYGPKGIGALYIRNGVKIEQYMHGGAQENRKRAGTENVAGIVAFGKACEMADLELEQESKRLTKLSDKLIDGILNKIEYSKLNGHRTKRLPGNVNIGFEFIEGESVLLMLDFKGIQASSGSACTSGSLDPSHVLLALGLPHEKAHGSLRVTLGLYNTEEEIDTLINELPPIVERLREMSPLYEDMKLSSR